MPPKARITQEMIVEEAFQIARQEGVEKITVRALAQRLGCSTQPVLYSFPTVEAIRQAAVRRAEAFHERFLLEAGEGNPLLQTGLNYVRFAVEEPRLFRLLFQSGSLEGDLTTLMQTEAPEPVVRMLCAETGATEAEAREIFTTLFIYVHGCACLYAGNALSWDEAALAERLKKVFYGACAACAGQKEEAE